MTDPVNTNGNKNSVNFAGPFSGPISKAIGSSQGTGAAGKIGGGEVTPEIDKAQDSFKPSAQNPGFYQKHGQIGFEERSRQFAESIKNLLSANTGMSVSDADKNDIENKIIAEALKLQWGPKITEDPGFDEMVKRIAKVFAGEASKNADNPLAFLAKNINKLIG